MRSEYQIFHILTILDQELNMVTQNWISIAKSDVGSIVEIFLCSNYSLFTMLVPHAYSFVVISIKNSFYTITT